MAVSHAKNNERVWMSENHEVLLASVVRMLSLAVHDNDPNHLFTARRLLQSISPDSLNQTAATRAIAHAQQLIDDHLNRCNRFCFAESTDKKIH